ncbi:class I SAM-dependent methyltransferase [Bradyrhizobium sp. SZCCHNS1054]|uniref:class I SAM-dependent methyltransferase n=1 Tax=Bradyrhizobium sp. SZCCHNS1054 TaxID=3057301 RepID=UPI002916E5DE|nr:methyltransferase domain-containing protein [Bradyrhizobium sp. SZCCHNS1054]
MCLRSSRCRICAHEFRSPALALGHLPVCNRFTSFGDAKAELELDVVECSACQLIQLRNVPSVDTLIPTVPWIRYREPEGHLDALVHQILTLHPNARTACGTGPFEEPLLSRLAEHSLDTHALGLDVAPIEGRYPYLESWQASINAPRLAKIGARYGTFDIVSCRYILEHSPEPVIALVALKQLLNPRGLLLIEVPDSSKFLAARDYCWLWEEHSSYFVEDTLRRLVDTAGYNMCALLRYPGVLEDALVAVLQARDSPGSGRSSAILGSSSLFQAYREAFIPTRKVFREKLTKAAGPARDRIALFGIGHHAIMLVNAFALTDLIALAVDDDPDKAGFFPPGFHIPVVSSEFLLADEHIGLCLFAIAPHIESKVLDKLSPLAARGVEFRSIYAARDNSIMKDRAL